MKKDLLDKKVLGKLEQVAGEVQDINNKLKDMGLDYQFEILAVDKKDSYVKNYEGEIRKSELNIVAEKIYIRLQELEELGKQYNVIILDIVEFKYINHILAYKYGDLLIEEITSFLGNIQENITLYKYAIDKFVLVIEGETIQESIEVVNTIMERFDRSWEIEDKTYSCDVRAGLGRYNTSQLSINQFFSKLECDYLYLKHNDEHDFVIIDDSMYKKFIRKEIVTKIVKKALKEKTLQVHYQPIYDTQNKKIIKLEALARLYDEATGFIPPLEFIEVVEEKGLIHEMGDIVIEKVCEQIKKLEKEQVEFERISINVSAVQFMSSSFSERVANILKEYDVSPTKIEFELTENVFIHSISKVIEVMNEMSKTGIIFSLDDFGTGYSSLGYLAKLPINAIKIDKTFVDNIAKEDSSLILLKNIIQLGKELGVITIAEGVETNEQYNILNALNCSAIQGYLFSKPVNGEEVIDKFRG